MVIIEKIFKCIFYLLVRKFHIILRVNNWINRLRFLLLGPCQTPGFSFGVHSASFVSSTAGAWPSSAALDRSLCRTISAKKNQYVWPKSVLLRLRFGCFSGADPVSSFTRLPYALRLLYHRVADHVISCTFWNKKLSENWENVKCKSALKKRPFYAFCILFVGRSKQLKSEWPRSGRNKGFCSSAEKRKG